MKKPLLFLVLFAAMGGSSFAQQQSVPIVSGVATLDVERYSKFKVVLNQNVTSVVLSPSVGVPNTTTIGIFFLENATGGFTVTFGGNTSGTCTVTTNANAGTICSLQFDSGSNTWFVTGGGGGITSPSSLTTFFTKFFGLSPTDAPYGAKGDTHIYGGAAMTANIAVMTNVTAIFSSTDVGKQFEMWCPGGAANPIRGTITAFNSTTSVNTSVACTVTVTNQGMAFGTDDTVALQAWIAAMIAAAVKGVPAVARSGYIPQGGFWTTKRLAFIYPSGQDGVTGECAPAPGVQTGNQLRCSLWLMGAGTDNSFFYYPSDFQWQFPSTSADVCGVLINHWDFAQINNFSVQAPLANGVVNWNTSTNTGSIGGMCFSDNTHQAVSNLYISGFHNTQTNMAGVNIVSDFESTYGYSAVEVNDIDWAFNQYGAVGSTGVLNANVFEKILLDTVFLENPNATAFGNMSVQGTFKQLRMRNIHFRSDNGTIVVINVRTGTIISNGDAFICDQCRVTDVQGTGHLGITIQSAGRYVFPELYYENLNSVSTSANAVAFTLQSAANINLGLQGGAINCVGCTNAVNYVNNSPTVYAMDLTLTSPTNHANFSRGTGTTNAFFRTASGWDGGGTIQSTLTFSNQGTAAANGQVALSAGWGTTATVTAAAGFAQHARFTLTSSGTGQAANPTVTWTVPNAFPSATVLCTAVMAGGTGTLTTLNQTGLSATAPVFTFNSTPVAASTYIVDIVCGP